MAVGALMGLAFVLAFAFTHLPSKRRQTHARVLARCVRYFLVPVEWICGKKVIWVNPDGSHVLLGNADQLRMPRPRPVQR